MHHTSLPVSVLQPNRTDTRSTPLEVVRFDFRLTTFLFIVEAFLRRVSVASFKLAYPIQCWLMSDLFSANLPFQPTRDFAEPNEMGSHLF